jgi:hypothetical protein
MFCTPPVNVWTVLLYVCWAAPQEAARLVRVGRGSIGRICTVAVNIIHVRRLLTYNWVDNIVTILFLYSIYPVHCPKRLLNFVTDNYSRWATVINNENFRYWKQAPVSINPYVAET